MKWFNENVCDVRNYIVIHKNQSHKLYGLGQKQMRNVSRYMFCNHRCCTNIIENKKISPMPSFYYDFYFLLHFYFFFRFCCCWFSATHVNINRKLFGTSRSQQIENVSGKMVFRNRSLLSLDTMRYTLVYAVQHRQNAN